MWLLAILDVANNTSSHAPRTTHHAPRTTHTQVEAAFEQLTARLMGDEPHSADDDAALARILEAINERESKLMDEAPVRACIALCC